LVQAGRRPRSSLANQPEISPHSPHDADGETDPDAPAGRQAESECQEQHQSGAGQADENEGDEVEPGDRQRVFGKAAVTVAALVAQTPEQEDIGNEIEDADEKDRPGCSTSGGSICGDTPEFLLFSWWSDQGGAAEHAEMLPPFQLG